MTLKSEKATAAHGGQPWRAGLYGGVITALVAAAFSLLLPTNQPLLWGAALILLGAAPVVGNQLAHGRLGREWGAVVGGLLGGLLPLVGWLLFWPLLVWLFARRLALGWLYLGSGLGAALGVAIFLAIGFLFGQNPELWFVPAWVMAASMWGGATAALMRGRMSAQLSSPTGAAQKQATPQPPTAAPTAPPTAPPSAPKNATGALGLDDLLRVTGPRIWIGLVALLVVVAGILVWSIVGVIPQVVPGDGMLLRGGVQNISAPDDGSLTTVDVSENSRVKAGDVVATMMTEAGEKVEIKATDDGTVTGINIPPGFSVRQGAEIMTVEVITMPLLAVVYVPLGDGKQISPGMAVQLSPSVADVDSYGYLMGTVSAISEFPVSQNALTGGAYIDSAAMAATLGGDVPVLRMIIQLDEADTPSGYRWSSSSGPDFQLRNGTATSARVIVDETRPISLFLPISR
jgi:biotin carboxyl carrier protein